MYNNIKIKFYKRKDLSSLKKYKRLTITLSIICSLLILVVILGLYNYELISSEIYDTKKTDSIYTNLPFSNKQNQIPHKHCEGLCIDTCNLSINYKKLTDTIAKIKNNETKTYHTVQQGETVYAISNIYNVKVSDIVQLNNIHNYIIHVDDSLLILTNLP